jgi:MFS family permease
VTGFAASAVCSSIMGPYVDKYGRKAACVIYCILEVSTAGYFFCYFHSLRLSAHL